MILYNTNKDDGGKNLQLIEKEFLNPYLKGDIEALAGSEKSRRRVL